MEKSAVISECGLYRYLLRRIWASGPIMTWVMLNPSTADADVDDPTIRKCIQFATLFGFYGIHVINLFAFRATSPKDLKKAKDPVGYLNHHYIEVAPQRDRDCVVAAWGNHGTYGNQDKRAIESFQRRNVSMFCLGKNNNGTPMHPLYIPYNSLLIKYP